MITIPVVIAITVCSAAAAFYRCRNETYMRRCKRNESLLQYDRPEVAYRDAEVQHLAAWNGQHCCPA